MALNRLLIRKEGGKGMAIKNLLQFFVAPHNTESYMVSSSHYISGNNFNLISLDL